MTDLTLTPIVQRRARSGRIGAFVRAQPQGAIAFVVIAIMLLAGIFAPFVAPYDPVEIDFASVMAPPSAVHIFGTDPFGRDVLTRIIYGARTAMVIGFLSSFLGCSIGALIGVASVYYGGKVDLVVQRAVDIMMVFPVIVMALVVVSMLGRHPVLGIDMNLILAIGIPIIPQVARVIRSAALPVRAAAYVDAAQLAGFSSVRIILGQMIPNVVAPYIILVTAFIAQAILLEASLSFLGLGVADPTPAWGLMLSGSSADFYRQAPWIIIFPGVAISVAVFAFNFFGDSLRDWLDPKFHR
ncbi:MAG: transporter permease [Rhizobium sp.]|nr:transporter permease [Rhizobium sp.]